MIAISCTTCQKKLSVQDTSAGKKAKCPGCGQVLPVPALAAVARSLHADDRTVPPMPMAEQDQPTQESLPDAGNPPTHPPLSRADPTIDVAVVPRAQFDTSLTDFLAPPQADDELGRLGKYRILKILGHGGMGVVYKAEDTKLKRTVAIKAMLPTLAASASSSKRFMREAEAMAAVENDHVVRIYDTLEERGVPFMAMEFLKGEPLDERLRREERIALTEMLRIGREIAEGLGAAHATGLIHRDIKPANIWLESPRNRVKILDFGLARAATQDAGLTQQGSIIGTPAYMAPEQGRGDDVDVRCDLFSLGVVLYRLCTGQQPFHGKDTVSTLMSVAMHHPEAPIQLNADLPPELSELVMKLLEKDIAKRIGSANEVVRALQKMEQKLNRRQASAEETVTVTQPLPPMHTTTAKKKEADTMTVLASPSGSRVEGEGTSRRRSKLPLVLAALLLLGILGGGALTVIVFFWQTPNGVVRIEINDPDIQVVFGEKELTFTGVNKQDVKVSPGEYGLHIKRNDLEFDTDKFILKKGETITLKIEWLAEGKLQVVQGDKVIGQKARPKPPPLDDAWLKAVAAMPAAEQVDAVAAKLKERNPGFDGKIKSHAIEDDAVVELKLAADHIVDLSPVRALAELRSLHCDGTQEGKAGLLTDLAPLQGMKLQRLSCSNTKVSDLTPLKDMSLGYLNLNQTQVSDLAPLKGMSVEGGHLLIGGTKVSNLTPLKGMKLTNLHFWGTPVGDLAPLKGMLLEDLHCGDTQVADLSPLCGMPLQDLHCEFDPKRDSEILRSIKTLERINGRAVADFWKAQALPAKLPAVAEAGVLDYAEIHDAAEKRFDAWIAQVKKDGYRPVRLNVQTVKDAPRYTAIAVKENKNWPWEFSRVDQGVEGHARQRWDRKFEAVAVALYRDKGKTREAYLWAKDESLDNNGLWFGDAGFTDNKVKIARKEKTRLVSRCAVFEGSVPQYCVLIEDPDGVAWQESYTLSFADLKAYVEKHKADGWRPDHFTYYGVGAKRLFGAILIKDSNQTDWDVSWSLSAVEYEKELVARKTQGFRPLTAIGHEDSAGEQRFSAIWIRYRDPSAKSAERGKD